MNIKEHYIKNRDSMDEHNLDRDEKCTARQTANVGREIIKSAEKQPKEESEWDELRKIISNEIVDETEERRIFRQRINTFKSILKSHHVTASQTIKKLISRPFRKLQLGYISTKIGTIRYKDSNRKFPLTNSLSLPDLTIFYKNNSNYKEHHDWYKANIEHGELNEFGIETEKKVDMKSNPIFRHIRYNSANFTCDIDQSLCLVNDFKDENELVGVLDLEEDDEISEADTADSTYSSIDEKEIS
jgi:hypothetical protein